MSFADVAKMSDTTKAMLFMFLGLLIAILVLGFHKSPPASPALGAAQAGFPSSSPSPIGLTTYPSDRSDY